MKANLHTVSGAIGKGPFQGHEIRLTIGLIVKNEEETLDKCLSSLKPLLEAVPSELIITDTGSTDKTLEIAKKYTDNIINFEWCGDFSAARNTGLFAARGEWFMFIDGDEWFEDVTEVIDFFNSGECDRYWTCCYTVRNYNDFKGLTYNDSMACRLFRQYSGIHFKNKVHEDIIRVTPTKILNAFVHHYGYVFHNEKEKNEKFNRNLTMLLDEIKNSQTDLKAYSQLIGQYIALGNFQKAIEYSNQALEIEKQNTDDWRRRNIQLSLSKAYFLCGRFQSLMELIDEFISTEKKDSLFHLDILRLGQESAFKLKDYNRSVELGEKYLEIYREYEEKKLDETAKMYAMFDSLGVESREKAIVRSGFSYIGLGNSQKVLECIRSLDLSLENSLHNGSLPLCFSAADQSGNGVVISEFYHRILDLNDETKKNEFIIFTEPYKAGHQDQCRSIECALADVHDFEDDYIYLNRIRVAEANQNRNEALQILEWFSGHARQWNMYFSDILYYVFREKINMLPYILQIETDDLPSIVKNMQKQHLDYVDIVTEYFKSFSFENVKALYWTVCLMEKAILAQEETNNREEYLSLFKSYAQYSAKYVRSIYRQEMFQPANFSALPRACRFGFYMGEALAAHEKGNSVAYLSGLRSALKEYPIMEKPIKMMLEDFEKEKNTQEAKAKEFQKLAKQVKQKIEDLILQGDMRQAGQVTLQLAKLMPDDIDVQRYQKLTNTEPTMAELASRLPQ